MSYRTYGLAVACSLLFYSNNPQIQVQSPRPVILRRVDATANLIRSNLNPEIIAQLEKLAYDAGKDNPEAGGYLYAVDGRLAVLPIGNSTHADIAYIERLDLQEPSNLDLLESIVAFHFASGTCNPESSDADWKERIKSIRQNIAEARQDLRYNVEDLRIKVMAALKDIYRRKTTPETIPNIVAGIHTHRNKTSFSEVDKCISAHNPQPLLLVSYGSKLEEGFDLYVMVDGEEVKLGSHP